jgi:SNF2 family DNA or RNA helicase
MAMAITMTATTTMEMKMENSMILFKKYLKRTGLDYKQHQYDGVTWCLEKEFSLNNNEGDCYGGGFICDEMGLGKTIIIIGLLVSRFVKRTLIVLPKSLVSQWYSEIYRTTGNKACILNNKKLKKKDPDYCWDFSLANIVIATYSSSQSEILKNENWDRIVFDEAHELRNKGTKKYNSAFELKSRIRWFVSGTIVQNRASDLTNIIEIGRFKVERKENGVGFKNLPMLKRTKIEVGINIPEVNVISTLVKWKNENEKYLAKDIHRENILMTEGKGKVLEKIIRSRQVCIMPSLVGKKIIEKYLLYREKITDPSPSSFQIDAIETLLQSQKNQNQIQNQNQNFTSTLVSSENLLQPYCSKLNAVIDQMMKNKGNGNGKIVFCYFKDEIDYLFSSLKKNGFDVAIFDGRGGGKEILLKKYDVLLLQIQVGSTGLNLQKDYNEVYFTSYHWNPQIEKQAIARCHRIGQTKPVVVYKFMMENFTNLEDTFELNKRKIEIVNNDECCDDTDTEEKETISIEKYIEIVQHRKNEIITSIMMV